MLRMCLGYRGSIMWKMQAGMGDAIFAPMYEALKARGVQVRVLLRGDRDRRLAPTAPWSTAITVRRQARLVAGDRVRPAGPRRRRPAVAGPPSRCYDQLVGGEAALRDIKFEACQAVPGRDRRTR